MRVSKIVAILGAIIIIVAFFLTWAEFSLAGITTSGTGFGMAIGRPSGMDKPLSGLSGYSSSADRDFIESTLENYIGTGAGAFAGAVDSLNKMFADWSLFFFPGLAIVVILFCIFTISRPTKAHGAFLVILALFLGIFLFMKFRTYASLANIGRLGGAVFQLLGEDRMMPSYSLGIGFYGTIAGLVILLIAGFMGWQDKETKQAPAQVYNYYQVPPNSFQNYQPSQTQPQKPFRQSQEARPTRQQTYQEPSQPQIQPPYQNTRQDGPVRNWRSIQQPQQPYQQPDQWQAPQQPPQQPYQQPPQRHYQQPGQWQAPQQPPQQPYQQPGQWQPPSQDNRSGQ